MYIDGKTKSQYKKAKLNIKHNTTQHNQKRGIYVMEMIEQC